MSLPTREDRKLTHCTNCETQLQEGENFCPACGQKNLDRKVPLWVFLGDFIRDELKIDNRLFRTLRHLSINPGFLTNEFIAGKRKSYIQPPQLFLLMGFLCFFIISIQIDPEIKKIDKSDFNIGLVDGLGVDSTSNNVFLDFIRERADEAEENPAAFISNSLQKLPIVLLIVLPIFALFQHLIYIRHKMFFVEHFVFLLHVHAFLFLLFFFASFFMMFMNNVQFFIYIPFIHFLYLLFAFRKVYNQGLTKTFFKLSFLFFIYIALVPGLWIFFRGLLIKPS
ncbi:MAG: DUF3667 domain-containing protein [Bacteroidota bacterium]